jgi:hypothetical protein
MMCSTNDAAVRADILARNGVNLVQYERIRRRASTA